MADVNRVATASRRRASSIWAGCSTATSAALRITQAALTAQVIGASFTIDWTAPTTASSHRPGGHARHAGGAGRAPMRCTSTRPASGADCRGGQRHCASERSTPVTGGRRYETDPDRPRPAGQHADRRLRRRNHQRPRPPQRLVAHRARHRLIFREPGHCRNAYTSELLRAHFPKSYRGSRMPEPTSSTVGIGLHGWRAHPLASPRPAPDAAARRPGGWQGLELPDRPDVAGAAYHRASAFVAVGRLITPPRRGCHRRCWLAGAAGHRRPAVAVSRRVDRRPRWHTPPSAGIDEAHHQEDRGRRMNLTLDLFAQTLALAPAS